MKVTSPLRKLSGLTVTVKLSPELRLRMRIGIWLVELGVAVLGARTNIEIDFASGGFLEKYRSYVIGEDPIIDRIPHGASIPTPPKVGSTTSVPEK